MPTASCDVMHNMTHNNMTDDDGWDLSGACTSGGNFPFYCSAEEANEVAHAAGSSGSHQQVGFEGYYMPNGAPDMTHDGSYDGDAETCDCSPMDCHSLAQANCAGCTDMGECTWHNAHCHAMPTASCDVMHNMTHNNMTDDDGWDLSGACTSGGNFPFYCSAEEANEVAHAAGSSGSHQQVGFEGYYMPNGAPDMTHDGSYDGDAKTCDCPDAGTGTGSDDLESTDESSSKKKKKSSNPAWLLPVIVVGVAFFVLGFVGAIVAFARAPAAQRKKNEQDERSTPAVVVAVPKKVADDPASSDPKEDAKDSSV